MLGKKLFLVVLLVTFFTSVSQNMKENRIYIEPITLFYSSKLSLVGSTLSTTKINMISQSNDIVKYKISCLTGTLSDGNVEGNKFVKHIGHNVTYTLSSDEKNDFDEIKIVFYDIHGKIIFGKIIFVSKNEYDFSLNETDIIKK